MKPAAVRSLAALLAGGVALVGVELGKGALERAAAEARRPVQPQPARTGGIDATIQRIVLDGLDGAACRLHTTREELVLSLGGGRNRAAGTSTRSRSPLRAGLLRSVDGAERRGDVPGFVAPTLRRLVERAPLGKLIRGGFSLSDLLG